MISAFGIEHTISKGLPRGIRAHAEVGHPAIIGWQRGGPKDDYVTHRAAAHWYGKESSRAEGAKRKALKEGKGGKRLKNVVTPTSGDKVAETDVLGLTSSRAAANRLQGKYHRDRSRELS